MRLPLPDLRSRLQQGYTLIEALIASGILAIGVAAASSMSLTLVTQEEINERSIRAFNYLDNAAQLARLHVPADQIEALLPHEPSVIRLTTTTRTQAISQIEPVPIVKVSMVYRPTSATAALPTGTNAAPTWVGGKNNATRTEYIDVVLDRRHFVEDFYRVANHR